MSLVEKSKWKNSEDHCLKCIIPTYIIQKRLEYQILRHKIFSKNQQCSRTTDWLSPIKPTIPCTIKDKQNRQLDDTKSVCHGVMNLVVTRQIIIKYYHHYYCHYCALWYQSLPWFNQHANKCTILELGSTIGLTCVFLSATPPNYSCSYSWTNLFILSILTCQNCFVRRRTSSLIGVCLLAGGHRCCQ